MNIELGLLHDGRVMMVSDTPLPDIVCRIEYYREQRMFMLVYNSDRHEEEMMQFEVPKDMTQQVENAPNIMIYSLFPDHEPIGYKAPLIQVGDMI